MDQFVLGERELEADLESGGNTSEEDRTGDDNLIPTNIQKDEISKRAWSAVYSFAESKKFVCDETAHSTVLNFYDGDRNVELSMCKNSDSDESVDYTALVAKNHVKEKCKKINSRNPHKPPRPPKGPSLDAADRKLIKEMAEMAVRKRARVERMRALKKMKASKALPVRSSLSGMVVTLLFCLVLIYQGLSSRTSNTPTSSSSLHTPAVSRNEDLVVSLQFHNNLSTSHKSADNNVTGSDLQQGEADGTIT